VDDFPKRLSDENDIEKAHRQHLGWMETEAARARFAASPFIRTAWPAVLRAPTLAAFEYQQMIDDARGVRLRTVGPGERIRRLHAALEEGELSVLSAWWLGIDADQIAAMTRHLERGGPEDAHHFRLGARALSQRTFDVAAEHFAAVDSNDVDPTLLAYAELYARCRAGDGEAAAAFVRARSAERRGGAEDRAFLAWLSERLGCGV
jgi:hypothetical protein